MSSKYSLCEGCKIANLIREGKLQDFYKYMESKSESKLITLNKSIGIALASYIQTLSDDEANKLVDMLFTIKNWNKIDALRIAKHIAVNFERYKDKSVVNAYINIHKPEIITFNSAMIIAKNSSFSKVIHEYKL